LVNLTLQIAHGIRGKLAALRELPGALHAKYGATGQTDGLLNRLET
jgi:hypothetical protein